MENKYQEAYEYLLGLLTVGDDIKWPLVNKSMEAFKELVDKETPKKYKVEISIDAKITFKCPNCGQIFKTFKGVIETVRPIPYCFNCGQALDWGK